MRAARWRAGVLLAWVLALGLTGCAASVVYPRLDTLVGLYVRGLVSLDDSQSARLARTLEHNLEWHRRDELERYEAFLRELAARVAGGLTRPALEDAALRAETYWRRIFEQAAPGYTDLAATLTDRQVRELLQNLERADEKTWREHTQRTSEQRFRDREKSVRKHVERVTGPLDAAQRRLISDYAWGARPFMFEWRDNRRRWREELEATLRVRTGPREAFAARMRVLIAEPDSLWTAEYRQALATSRAELLDLVLQLDATLTPQQRARAQQRLLALAEDMRDLALRRG
ncbi:MAG TPA: DUF6279 family lipoprotein [Steroidobacteraceae bacterium]|nr:DUF6279 family lipoprotein [Steroidobacteraceae bacterium]